MTGPRSLGRRRRLLAVLAVSATLASLELGIRLYDGLRGRSSNARTAWYWAFEPDPYLGYRGRANAEVDFGGGDVYRHNAEGFRDDRELRRIAPIPGRRLVICVGESSTYGTGAPSAATSYPARLEAHLRRLSGDASWYVYNAGVPAYTSHQIVGLLALRLLKFRPEAVVMMNLRNDVEFMARRVDASTDFGELPRTLAPLPVTWWSELAMRSSLVGLIASRAYKPPPDRSAATGPLAPPTARGTAFYLDNLAIAALDCRRAPTRLMLVDQPIFDDAYDPSRRRATAEMRAAMKATCLEAGVPVLRANQPLHDSGFVSPDEVHLGTDGYDRLAAILAPQVLETLAAPR